MSDTVKSNEQFYDEEIAPVILELMKKCRDRGMGLHAAVYDGEEVYESYVSGEQKIAERMNFYAIKSLGNADKFIMSLLNDVEKNGHNSIYLKFLEDHAAGKYQIRK